MTVLRLAVAPIALIICFATCSRGVNTDASGVTRTTRAGLFPDGSIEVDAPVYGAPASSIILPAFELDGGSWARVSIYPSRTYCGLVAADGRFQPLARRDLPANDHQIVTDGTFIYVANDSTIERYSLDCQLLDTRTAPDAAVFELYEFLFRFPDGFAAAKRSSSKPLFFDIAFFGDDAGSTPWFDAPTLWNPSFAVQGSNLIIASCDFPNTDPQVIRWFDPHTGSTLQTRSYPRNPSTLSGTVLATPTRSLMLWNDLPTRKYQVFDSNAQPIDGTVNAAPPFGFFTLGEHLYAWASPTTAMEIDGGALGAPTSVALAATLPQFRVFGDRVPFAYAGTQIAPIDHQLNAVGPTVPFFERWDDQFSPELKPFGDDVLVVWGGNRGGTNLTYGRVFDFQGNPKSAVTTQVVAYTPMKTGGLMFDATDASVHDVQLVDGGLVVGPGLPAVPSNAIYSTQVFSGDTVSWVYTGSYGGVSMRSRFSDGGYGVPLNWPPTSDGQSVVVVHVGGDFHVMHLMSSRLSFPDVITLMNGLFISHNGAPLEQVADMTNLRLIQATTTEAWAYNLVTKGLRLVPYDGGATQDIALNPPQTTFPQQPFFWEGALQMPLLLADGGQTWRVISADGGEVHRPLNLLSSTSPTRFVISPDASVLTVGTTFIQYAPDPIPSERVYLLPTSLFAIAAASQPDAAVDDAGVADAGLDDAGADAGQDDAGQGDAGTPGGGTADAGTADAGPVDAGPVDAGALDAGPADAGVPDAGAGDSGLPNAQNDAGVSDAGGALDGGVSEPRRGQFIVGCHVTPVAPFGLAALAFWVFRRRNQRLARVL